MRSAQWVGFHSSFFFDNRKKDALCLHPPSLKLAVPIGGPMSTVCEVHLTPTNLSSLDKYDKDSSDSPGGITGPTAKQD